MFNDGIEHVVIVIGWTGSTLAGVAALFIALTGLARSTKARLLAGAHIAVGAAFWINLANWNGGGCWWMLGYPWLRLGGGLYDHLPGLDRPITHHHRLLDR